MVAETVRNGHFLLAGQGTIMTNPRKRAGVTQAVRAKPAGVRGGSGLASKLALAVFAVALAGCSSVPDAVNPVEWYKGVEGWFDDDDGAESGPAKPVPGADKPYPNLANVGDKPAARSAAERRKVAEGLVSDRENARYADESLRKAAPPAPPPNAARQPRDGAALTPPPPRPAPRVPVQGSALPPSGASASTPAPKPAASSAPAASPGGEVQKVYSERLRQSAPTVTTAPAGPTAQPDRPTGPVRAEARPLSEAPAPASTQMAPVQTAAAQTATPPAGPRSLREFDASQAGVSYRVAVVYHGRGSAALPKAADAQLREVAALQKESGGTLRIVGHASSQTRDMSLVRHRLVNFKLSMDRANATAKRLAELGVDPGAMFVGAVSDSQPVYHEVMPAGEAANRRTEIYIDQ